MNHAFSNQDSKERALKAVCFASVGADHGVCKQVMRQCGARCWIFTESFALMAVKIVIVKK